MNEPTDIAGLMALVDQLVEHAREDDRMCYDQAPSQRFQDARDELQAVLAKWGQPQAVAGGEPVAWLSVDCIGERYLCFTRPDDDDPVRPLVFGDTAPPTHDQETPASIAVAAARKMLKEET